MSLAKRAPADASALNSLPDLEEELEREKTIRRRILRDFNKFPEDFSNDQEYEDYLEMVEEIIYNLVHNIDVERTNERIAVYRKENAALIRRNQLKRQEREHFEAARLAEEERARQRRLEAMFRADEEEQQRRRLAEEQGRTRHLTAVLEGHDSATNTQNHATERESRGTTEHRSQGMNDGAPRVHVQLDERHRSSTWPSQRSPPAGQRVVVAMPSAKAVAPAQNPEERYPDPVVRAETARRAAGFDPEAWLRRARAQLCL
jgi:recombination DNA repair RAD52 pathway protein